MKQIGWLSLLIAAAIILAGCKKANEPRLIFKFKFDPKQARLNNFGRDTTMPAGHAGQNPSFNTMSAHYIELAPGALTPLGTGSILYKAPETNAGGSTAIDFEQSKFAGNNETFYSIPLKDVAKGEYEYLRVSLAYQNFDVSLFIDTVVSGYSIHQQVPCTVASFVGFNTYIKHYKVKDGDIAVNGNRAQGYWGFEAVLNFGGNTVHLLQDGQAPAGATTVVNPLFATSPIPAGSCLVTSAFNGGKLKITGNETNDIVVTVSLSTNKSFEWIDVINDGNWEPSKGENVVDMGLRGMIPYIQY